MESKLKVKPMFVTLSEAERAIVQPISEDEVRRALEEGRRRRDAALAATRPPSTMSRTLFR